MNRDMPVTSGSTKWLKKFLWVVSILLSISFLTAGCGNRGILKNKLPVKSIAGSSKEEVAKPQGVDSNKANENSGSTMAADKTKNSQAASDEKLQVISDEMDKLNESLKELDNTNDINTTESIINNIN